MSEWRAVSARSVLHIGDVTRGTGGGFRFVTRCGMCYFSDSLWDDAKRKRCKKCLDHEATREKSP